ncbi:protein-L-isoaspartate O-methyltransferase family protein [Mariprofundus ferrooxydans]|uniref:Protein-L-isoaspartate O-methyltransferase n=1 Tax=Mariprofundus ferrooxydans PV-1 TaxID=314345 RepID=Q0F2U2_9PROT|nr:protein-L-isoaspartate O-methyltransferase [Mariprofundus ferrooxydans]EAU56199.1 Protein-L-isoaspartate(D-aspartate) O-methyltransferase [Mariprofundus ferrooxydans PV-1]KON48040.1 protein-L-isoaspartate(D-aspartate) O-methyltransferase [Mariprofundus ferrooxydans]
MTVTDFQFARKNMVDQQIRCCKVLDASTLDLVESMPRENFVPEHVKSLAYMEGHVPLPCNQEMLSPLQEATIISHLALTGSERVLEIGTGTGFLTTMLAMQSGEVVSCEIHEPLAESARGHLQQHGITNAQVVTINAMDPAAVAACPEMQQPFDVIVLAAALREIPAHIEAMLTNGGKLIAFVGQNPVVSLILKTKNGQTWQQIGLFETLLLDMEGLPEKRQFIF